jgi:hypothetical protein
VISIVRLVNLIRDLFAIVDESDYDCPAQHKWHAIKRTVWGALEARE